MANRKLCDICNKDITFVKNVNSLVLCKAYHADKKYMDICGECLVGIDIESIIKTGIYYKRQAAELSAKEQQDREEK